MFEQIHNAGPIIRAEELVNSFLAGTDGAVFATNPDGSTFELKNGVTLSSIECAEMGRGSCYEENTDTV